MQRISEFFNLTSEQDRVLLPERKIVVSAGAGSGKTRSVIAKYLETLESAEADITQIVAVTFTENAAGELKSRISSEISRYIKTFGHHGNIAPGWRSKITSAPIGTIHSFCGKILRENAFRLDLPLSHSVISGEELQGFCRRAIAKFLISEIQNDSLRTKRLLEIESQNFNEVLRVLTLILKQASMFHIVPPFFSYEKYNTDKYWNSDIAFSELEHMDSELKTRIKNYINSLSSRAKKKKQDLYNFYYKIDMNLGVQVNIPYLVGIYKQVKTLPPPPSPGPAHRYLQYAKDLTAWNERSNTRQLLIEKIFSIMKSYDSELTSLYLDLASRAYDFLSDIKTSEEKIEYEDMILFTIRLFEENPDILKHYKESLKLIIIDEFQDTDSLQLRLINLLCSGPQCPRLIVVGDFNQSIYGFRGAQPEIFTSVLNDKSFKEAFISTNYRSNSALIQFFNVFFSKIFPQETYDQMRHPSTTQENNGPSYPVEMILVSSYSLSSGRVEKEARVVALRLKELQKTSSGKTALLFRRASNVAIYEKALMREGLKFQSRVGHGFYRLAEVRDVVSMLRYFLNPLDKLAEAVILRSPYFGASDAELFAHFRGETKTGDSFIIQYLHFLRQKRKEYLTGETFRAVDFVVNGLGYYAAALALPNGKTICLNLKKLLLIVEDLVSKKGYGLQQIVEHFDFLRQSEDENQEFDEIQDEAVISLMTVHAAKGLEFDNVFLCDTNYRKKSFTERVMLDSEEGFVLRYPGFSSYAWEGLKSRVEQRETEEEKRNLYVAMTRARQRLFIYCSAKISSAKDEPIINKDSFASFILNTYSNEEDSSPLTNLLSIWTIDEETIIDDPTDKKYAEHVSEEKGFAFSEQKKTTPVEFKYLDAVYEKNNERRKYPSLPDLFSPTDRRDAARLGSIMHRFLETWDFQEKTAPREIEFVLKEFLVSNPEVKKMLKDLSSTFLKSELFSIVTDAVKIRKELKFVIADPENRKTPKTGRIDLLTEEKCGLRLFDYKYMESMNANAQEEYKRQMDGYCEAIAQRFSKSLLSRHIVFIPRVELVSI